MIKNRKYIIKDLVPEPYKAWANIDLYQKIETYIWENLELNLRVKSKKSEKIKFLLAAKEEVQNIINIELKVDNTLKGRILDQPLKDMLLISLSKIEKELFLVTNEVSEKSEPESLEEIWVKGGRSIEEVFQLLIDEGMCAKGLKSRYILLTGTQRKIAWLAFALLTKGYLESEFYENRTLIAKIFLNFFGLEFKESRVQPYKDSYDPNAKEHLKDFAIIPNNIIKK